MISKFKTEVQAALERTGGIDLLDRLGEVYPSERRHSERVADTSMRAMLNLGGSAEDIVLAGYAGSLHDAGKVDEEIQELLKAPRKLTVPEMIKVRERHTALGASLINALKVSEQDALLRKEAAFTAFFHHHPAEELQKLAVALPVVRIVRIVDQSDAIQDVDRPYHAGNVLSVEETVAHIRDGLVECGAYDQLAGVVLDTVASQPDR